jgi:hypothetical protein
MEVDGSPNERELDEGYQLEPPGFAAAVVQMTEQGRDEGTGSDIAEFLD